MLIFHLCNLYDFCNNQITYIFQKTSSSLFNSYSTTSGWFTLEQIQNEWHWIFFYCQVWHSVQTVFFPPLPQLIVLFHLRHLQMIADIKNLQHFCHPWKWKPYILFTSPFYCIKYCQSADIMLPLADITLAEINYFLQLENSSCQWQHRATCCVGYCFREEVKHWFPGKELMYSGETALKFMFLAQKEQCKFADICLKLFVQVAFYLDSLYCPVDNC